MKTQTLTIGIIKPITVTVKADIVVKILLFGTILACINMVALM